MAFISDHFGHRIGHSSGYDIFGLGCALGVALGLVYFAVLGA